MSPQSLPIALAEGPSHVWGWLAVYSIVLATASLVGGLLHGRLKLSHEQTQHVVSLVAGLMLGIALLHLMPHAQAHGTGFTADAAGRWMLGGMLAMFALLRVFHFHQNEPPSTLHDHAGGAPDHSDCHGHAHAPPRLGWTGVLLGMGLHSVVDGIALGAALRSDAGHGDTSVPAAGVLIALALHKPLDSMSVAAIMAADGWGAKHRGLVNAGFALLCPVGAGLFLLGFGDAGSAAVSAALAFSAGVFLSIALADLLPEMEFHHHDRVTLSLMLLAGVGLAAALRFVEPGTLHP